MAKKIEESLLNDIRTLLTGMAVSFKDVLEKSIEKNEELIETASKEDKKDDAKNTETLIKENKKERIVRFNIESPPKNKTNMPLTFFNYKMHFS